MSTFSKKMTLIFGVFLLFLFLSPGQVTAQASSITLSKSPQYPGSFESVTISVTSRLVNINDKQTVWRQDGEIIRSGTGIDEVTISTGAVGETTVVTLQTTDGTQAVERSLSITPAAVDLIWEAAESYVPPFYEGKALHPGWGPVRVTAIPHVYEGNQRISRRNLVYTWEYNGLVYGDDSGRGENSFVVNAVPRAGNRVTVEVETAGGEIVARESITLPISGPEVVFYRRDPLLGTQLNEALGNQVNLDSKNEVTLQAVPYFFLVNGATAAGLTYDWNLNSSSISPTGDKNVLTLRRQVGVRGEASVSIDIEDETRLFPSVGRSIDIIF